MIFPEGNMVAYFDCMFPGKLGPSNEFLNVKKKQ